METGMKGWRETPSCLALIAGLGAPDNRPLTGRAASSYRARPRLVGSAHVELTRVAARQHRHILTDQHFSTSLAKTAELNVGRPFIQVMTRRDLEYSNRQTCLLKTFPNRKLSHLESSPDLNLQRRKKC